MRLTPTQLAALLEGTEWARLGARDVERPTRAGGAGGAHQRADALDLRKTSLSRCRGGAAAPLSIAHPNPRYVQRRVPIRLQEFLQIRAAALLRNEIMGLSGTPASNTLNCS
jgi:hypothetical protein